MLGTLDNVFASFPGNETFETQLERKLCYTPNVTVLSRIMEEVAAKARISALGLYSSTQNEKEYNTHTQAR